MKKAIILSMVLLVVGLMSCNKDQRAVKKLDGTWKAISYVITDNGTSIDYVAQGLDFTMTFDDCKLKNDQWCNMTQVLTFENDSETETALYKVAADGTRMVWKDNENSSSSTTLVITELTKTDLTLTLTDNGDSANLVFKKQ